MNVMDTQTKLDLRWITDPAALMALRPEWQDLCTAVQAEIFLTPDWFDLWWVHFGGRLQLAAMAVRTEGRLVALLPFYTEMIWVGPFAFRVARLAGTDPHCITFNLPVLPELAEHVLSAAFSHLLGVGRCDVVSLTPVSDRAAFLPFVRNICEAGSDLTLTLDPDGSHVMFDLPDSFDAYLAGLSRNRRGQIRSDLRRLNSQFGMEAVETVPDEAGFADFVRFHNSQWQTVGKGGHFADWPGSAAFFGALSAQSRPGWGVRIDSLAGRTPKAEHVDLAAVFSIVCGKTCHARLPARSLDPEAHRLSIGKAGLVMMIKGMIGAGIQQVEAGRGEYDYKLSLGGKDVPVHRMLISSATQRAAVRLRFLLGWAQLIDLLHYRIWFKRIAPPLRRITGLPPRQLWRLWIRTRV
jgi:CelD/BcsL family acetyltransferase involved in cellulose biosynthesis